jgi:hypothetical protein
MRESFYVNIGRRLTEWLYSGYSPSQYTGGINASLSSCHAQIVPDSGFSTYDGHSLSGY